MNNFNDEKLTNEEYIVLIREELSGIAKLCNSDNHISDLRKLIENIKTKCDRILRHQTGHEYLTF
jgi:hypothetical protein